MQFGRIWALRGPNTWTDAPALEIEIDPAPAPGGRPSDATRFPEAWSGPASAAGVAAVENARLIDHLRSADDRVEGLAAVTLWLQRAAGSDVHHRSVRRPASAPPAVIVEFEEEELARSAAETARQACVAIETGADFDLAGAIRKLRELAYDVRLGPSTGAIVKAAKARGIPIRRLNKGSLVQLGHGAAARRVLTAETDATGAIAEAVAQDKELTRSLLRSVGVPVPEGRPVTDVDDAWAAAEDIGVPVVVKPQFGNHGRGVATNLTTREQVTRAYAAAKDEDSNGCVIVEKFAPGDDHRMLVIGGKLVAAALREPAHVIGDGRHTVWELVNEVNKDPRRSDGHGSALSFIKIDAVAEAVLADQGFNAGSIPPAGTRVLIRRNGNLSTGGTATDVTDRVHPEAAARAVEAAAVVGLDIAGVDVVAVDLSRPLESQGAAVVEVNAGPGLRMHLEPSAGTGRPVGQAIVDMLFPAGVNGRIPIAAVSGVNGKTTTTRLLAHLVRQSGKTVGMTCTDGLYLGDRRIDSRDCSGPQSARAILINPRAEAAVFETARGGILREGLGFDRCDVAVVTNIGRGDHLGLRGIETLEELARVKQTVVRAVAPSGSAVLNAADPLVAAMAPACRGSVIWFARDAHHSVVAAHLRNGGRAAVCEAGSVRFHHGDTCWNVISLERVPVTRDGRIPFQVLNVLAASAAAWALGLEPATIAAALESFGVEAVQSPGRFNIFRFDGRTVVVDYAHNVSAVEAVVEAVKHFPERRRSAVFSGFNRRDEDLVEMGKLLGGGFDRVILFADRGNRGRADGELNRLLRTGLDPGPRCAAVAETDDEAGAVRLALSELGVDELLVIGAESVDATLRQVGQHIGRPV